jgi:hypothetical protein
VFWDITAFYVAVNSPYYILSTQNAMYVWKMCISKKDRVTLHLKASKTDPFPEGVDIHLFSSGASVCPVISLEDMLNLEIKHLKGIMIKNHSL